MPALGLDPAAFACVAAAGPKGGGRANIPKGAWSGAAVRCVASASRLSASITASDKHLGRSAAHFLGHTVSCLMSGIGVHCMALNMAMVTISFEGAITEDERARTSPAKSSKIPFCGKRWLVSKLVKTASASTLADAVACCPVGPWGPH